MVKAGMPPPPPEKLLVEIVLAAPWSFSIAETVTACEGAALDGIGVGRDSSDKDSVEYAVKKKARMNGNNLLVFIIFFQYLSELSSERRIR